SSPQFRLRTSASDISESGRTTDVLRVYTRWHLCAPPCHDIALVMAQAISKSAHDRTDGDVYALFHAAVGQQLQGEARPRPARTALPARRGRHPQGREPHARVPGEEPERPGSIA